MEQLLTPIEIAEKLGVKLSTVYSWTHKGLIPHIKLRRHLRFNEKEINRWLAKRTKKAGTERFLDI